MFPLISQLRATGDMPDPDEVVVLLSQSGGAVLVIDQGVPGQRALDHLKALSAALMNEMAPAPAPPLPPPPVPAPPPPPPPVFTKSADTKTLYVSSSSGNDANDGLSAEKAKKTIAKGVEAMRPGFPDWLLLKKGDTFKEPIGRWKTSGRSASEPTLVGAYGTGSRPLLLTGSQTAFEIAPGGGTPASVNSVTVTGLAFVAHTRSPNNPEFVGPAGGPGIRLAHICRDLVFDDLFVAYYTNGMSLEGWQPTITDQTRLNGVTVRRCVVVDSYNEGGHSQGIYAARVDRLAIEDNWLDHNGWGEGAGPGDDPTMFNHNLYLQYTNGLDVVVRRNVLSRASSHALQLRSGGVAHDNFVFRCPIGLQPGDGDHHVVGAKYEIKNNVLLEAGDIHPDPDNVAKAGGWGIVPRNPQASSVVIDGNIVAHCVSTRGNRRSIEKHSFATYANNVIWDWTTGGTTPVLPASTGPFKDPNRTIANYAGSAENFFAKIRAQSRDSYDPKYSAEALNAYFREGFQKV